MSSSHRPYMSQPLSGHCRSQRHTLYARAMLLFTLAKVYQHHASVGGIDALNITTVVVIILS